VERLGADLLAGGRWGFLMKIDTTLFKKLVDDRLLSVQKHDKADLLIWNYTQKCQFGRAWTPETMMARGLITNSAGEVLARPFKKFFNYEEHTGEDSVLPPLPVEYFEVFDKLDGSLGILYWLGDTPQIATRGSFNSEQAIKGTEMLKKYNVPWSRYMTYLFEIIYPANRIVVDYGKQEDLVLLAIIDTETGAEVEHELIEDMTRGNIPIVKQFDGGRDLKKIKKLARDNAEGFVIRFDSGVRTKLKYKEYVRLHRLVTGVNAKTIWELLKNGQPFDELMEKVPDEFYAWVKKTKGELLNAFKEIEENAKKAYKEIEGLPTRKEQAFWLISSKYPFPGVVFKMLDKKPYEPIIWAIVRPKAERPFKEDIDA
jgi:RNA ligase